MCAGRGLMLTSSEPPRGGPRLCRLRSAAQEVRERRDQLRHVAPKPELLATRPKEVWSWDITKLLGPAKWTYYYL